MNSSGNPKNFRNSRKVDEVREVIQNKPEAEILKVLEYFNYDVGKTINAFINGKRKAAGSIFLF